MTGTPLTVEQIKKVNGYPVWVEDLVHPEKSEWRILYWDRGKYLVLLGKSQDGYILEEYGERWVAYTYPHIQINRKNFGCVWCEEYEDLPEHVSNGAFIGKVFDTCIAEDKDGWHIEMPSDPDVGIKYCPECGRPLTEEAWAELEKRLRG